MKLYTGIDLHSNNSYIIIQNKEKKVMYKKRLINDLSLILEALSPYKENIEGIAVESTYNWYWLVDGLIEAGYKVHLANPTAMKQYSGIKHTDDKSDARWLASLLSLNILPTGYIYPKKARGLREVLRQRLKLVREQTQNILIIQSMITRYSGIKISSGQIKNLTKDKLSKCLSDPNACIAATGQLSVLQSIMEQIHTIEKHLSMQLKSNDLFELLQTTPGIGKILATTILLETGDINRFKKVGDYSSYCRCVSSERISNEKRKGSNNKKNGNHYLGWAYTEAANFAIRYNDQIKSFYQKKINKVHRVSALKAVAHKLARACYYIMKNKEEFNLKKLFYKNNG